jgi:hypothetical protein
MASKLEEAGATVPSASRSRAPARSAEFGDVPEFIPNSSRR